MINRWLTNLFPLWVLGFGILALIHPPLFTWFSGSWIVWGLAVIMLGMGLTLTFADFRRVLAMPWPMVWSTFRVVVIPVLAGMVLHQVLPQQVQRLQGIAPVISVFTVALICASIVGQSAQTLLEHAGILLMAVILLHCGGFLLGYLISRLLRYDRLTAQTVSIEVGMQNSGLGVVLARGHFADPSTAVPCALSSVIHSVIGSLCAAWWRFRKEEQMDESTLKN